MYAARESRVTPMRDTRYYSLRATGWPQVIHRSVHMVAIEAETITGEDVDSLVVAALEDCDSTLDEMRAFATQGTFPSEAHRRAWFAIESLGAA